MSHGFTLGLCPKEKAEMKGQLASEGSINEERRSASCTAPGEAARGPAAVSPCYSRRTCGAKAFAHSATAVQPPGSVAAAQSHCICATLNSAAKGGRGRTNATRHRACGLLAVGPQPEPPRSDAEQMARTWPLHGPVEAVLHPSQGTRLLCVGQSQVAVSSERALEEQRDPLLASAQCLELRTLKLFVAAQSASHRAPFPGARQPRLPHAHTRPRGLQESQDRNLTFFCIVRLR